MSSQDLISIYDYVEQQNDEGYIVSLEYDGKTIMKIVKPSRYPRIFVDKDGDIIKGEFVGGKLKMRK
jgi:hypothetical protein